MMDCPECGTRLVNEIFTSERISYLSNLPRAFKYPRIGYRCSYCPCIIIVGDKHKGIDNTIYVRKED